MKQRLVYIIPKWYILQKCQHLDNRVSTPGQPWKMAIAENAAEIGIKLIFTKYNIYGTKIVQ